MEKTISPVIAMFLFFGSICLAKPRALTVSPVAFDHKLPLSQALALLGTRVQNGYVSFGIDLRNTPEPEVELKITEPTRLEIALAQVVGQVRGYGYQPLSEHVIEVYPVEEWSDPADVRRSRVGDFGGKTETATAIFSTPATVVPGQR